MEPSFKLCKELKAPGTWPINALLFSEDAKYLLSAGDDERVRVWNTDTFNCEQVLANENWAQVTHLTWLYEVLPTKKIVTTLCVGSARGYVTLYLMEFREVKPFSRSSVTIKVFDFNDSVEQQVFDKVNHRLATASHSGEFKVYLHNKGSLKLLWGSKLGLSIPSGVFFFGGANQSILTLCLENSELCCREASKDKVLWRKDFPGGVGCGALSSDEKLLLVNNLSTGNFDVYEVADDSPLRSLPISSKHRFIKQCFFFEGSKLAVCGSDTNQVHLVDVANNSVLQTLITGKEADMTQTIGLTPALSRRILIAGASRGSIYMWEKTPDTVHKVVETKPTPPLMSDRAWFLLLQGLLVIATHERWSPLFHRLTVYLTHFVQSEVEIVLRPADQV